MQNAGRPYFASIGPTLTVNRQSDLDLDYMLNRV